MIKKIMIVIVVVLVLGLVFRDMLIKQTIVSVGSSALGAPLKIGKFSLSLIQRSIHLEDVVIENPSGFSPKSLISIAHVNVNFHPLDILSGKLYFQLIDLNVRQLLIEKNKEGVFNVASLKIKPQKSDKPLDMRIDVMKLNVDHVIYLDETKGANPQEIAGLRNKTFKNITSPQQLVALVLFEGSGISSLKNIAMASTREVIGEVTDIPNKVVGKAGKTVKSILGTIKSTVDQQ